jgi:hypothetical protein
MKQTVWHVMIGIALMACFLGAAAFVAYLLYGQGVDIKVPDLFGSNATTSSATATDASVDEVAPTVLTGSAGVLFECEGGRALKAEFLAEKVNLALSDGRRVSLPEIPIETGAGYANTDGSFVFRTTDHSASLEEKDVPTYANCVMRP